MGLKEKFIAFVDILGWKEKINASEAGSGMSLDELIDAARDLGTPEDKANIEKYGPMICPQSAYVRRDLDFQLTRISDCVVVSSEVSPAGVINLVSHCWGAVIKLLIKGIMCRGYITLGKIYHTNEPDVMGTGYQKALDKEKKVSVFKRSADERGTPFVEVDASVCDFVREHCDSCVQEMFSRFVKQKDGMAAIFPFQRLQHSFIIGDLYGHKFDLQRERESNENVRSMILKMKGRIATLANHSRPDVERKVEHYIVALNDQLDVCRKTDEMLEMLTCSFHEHRES